DVGKQKECMERGQRDIGRDARAVEIPPHDWDLAEAPHTRIIHIRLMNAPRESREIEPLARLEILRHGNTKIRAARSLRFEIELIDARQIGRANPQVLDVGPDAIQLDGAVVVENGGTWRGCCESRRRRGEKGASKHVSIVPLLWRVHSGLPCPDESGHSRLKARATKTSA